MSGDRLEWERQVDQHELGTSLDWHSGPLVRIVDVVLDSSEEAHDLVLTVSHIIADGTTALLLLRRLVEHADRVAAAAPVDDFVVSRPVIGAPEDLLPARYRGPRGIARLAAIGLADGLSTALVRPRRLMPESPVNPSCRRTRLIRRALSSTQLDAAGTSLPIGGSHCALRARRRDGDGDRAHRGARRFGTNLYRLADRLRAELDPPVSADEAGAYVATVPSIVCFGGDRDVWSIARQLNRSLGRRRRFGQHLALLSASRLSLPRVGGEERQRIWSRRAPRPR